jgi:hypothetical protein
MMNGKHELDTMLLDETARGLAAMADKLDGLLRSALSDGDQAEKLAGQLVLQLSDVSHRFSNAFPRTDVQRETAFKQLEAQVVRGKENQELLKQQLSDVQVEVDVIYEVG